MNFHQSQKGRYAKSAKHGTGSLSTGQDRDNAVQQPVSQDATCSCLISSGRTGEKGCRALFLFFFFFFILMCGF